MKYSNHEQFIFLQNLNENSINSMSSILNQEGNEWHFCGFMSIRRSDVELLSLHPVSTATVANIFRKLGVTFGASAIFSSFAVHTTVGKHFLVYPTRLGLGEKCHCCNKEQNQCELIGCLRRNKT